MINYERDEYYWFIEIRIGWLYIYIYRAKKMRYGEQESDYKVKK